MAEDAGDEKHRCHGDGAACRLRLLRGTGRCRLAGCYVGTARKEPGLHQALGARIPKPSRRPRSRRMHWVRR
jgi:hypothetical protein